MRRRLLLLDLEGVVVKQEFLLEVARRAGIFEHVRREFYNGINGHTPWLESLKKRISLLRGVPRHVFEEVAATTTVSKTAAKLTRLLKEKGWHIGIVTGGFDILEPVVKASGVKYDWYVSHKLVFRDGRLYWYELGYDDKGSVARELKEKTRADVTVAVGDGWNDLGMFREADLSVGYRPKCTVKPHVDVEVRSFRQLWKLLRLI